MSFELIQSLTDDDDIPTIDPVSGPGTGTGGNVGGGGTGTGDIDVPGGL